MPSLLAGRDRGGGIKAAGYHCKVADSGRLPSRVDSSPNAAPGSQVPFSSNGQSLMPPGFGETLKPAQIDALVAYLMTLK